MFVDEGILFPQGLRRCCDELGELTPKPVDHATRIEGRESRC